LKSKSAKLAVYKGTKKKGSYYSFKVIPVKPPSLSINGRPYQGSFSFAAEDGYIRQSILLLGYLKGVALMRTMASKALSTGDCRTTSPSIHTPMIRLTKYMAAAGTIELIQPLSRRKA
jgi:hypothetical protein